MATLRSTHPPRILRRQSAAACTARCAYWIAFRFLILRRRSWIKIFSSSWTRCRLTCRSPRSRSLQRAIYRTDPFAVLRRWVARVRALQTLVCVRPRTQARLCHNASRPAHTHLSVHRVPPPIPPRARTAPHRTAPHARTHAYIRPLGYRDAMCFAHNARLRTFMHFGRTRLRPLTSGFGALAVGWLVGCRRSSSSAHENGRAVERLAAATSCALPTMFRLCERVALRSGYRDHGSVSTMAEDLYASECAGWLVPKAAGRNVSRMLVTAGSCAVPSRTQAGHATPRAASGFKLGPRQLPPAGPLFVATGPGAQGDPFNAS